MAGLKIFGFELIKSKSVDSKEKIASIVPPMNDDGAGYITASGSNVGHYFDLDGDKAADNHALIMKYRTVSQFSEVDNAIEDIVNEAIALDADNEIVELYLDSLEDIGDKTKDVIQEEFRQILNMLQFYNIKIF